MSFEKCWQKVNGDTFIDHDSNKLKKIVKYHSEMIYEESMKERTRERWINLVIWAIGFQLGRVIYEQFLRPLLFP